MNDAQDRTVSTLQHLHAIATNIKHELLTIVQSILTQLEDEILLGQDRGERIFENALKIQALEDLAHQDPTPPEPTPTAETQGPSPASVLIERITKECGLSRKALSTLCDVHDTSITNWANGKTIRPANYNRLVTLCEAFNLPITGDIR